MQASSTSIDDRSACDEHAAAHAWQELSGSRRSPERIEVLKQAPKSCVYRLTGLQEAGTLVAKRCLLPAARIERAVYEHILPHLPLASLRYFGFVQEPPGCFAWIFLEDAGDEVVARDYLMLAGWLGRLHAGAAELARRHLPEREVRDYLRHLERGCARIRKHRTSAEMGAADHEVLQRICDACAQLEAHWDRVEAMCRWIQPALVHGDLAWKNMRYRQPSRNRGLLVLDWETAGWGTPVPDLECLSPPQSSASPQELMHSYRLAGGASDVDDQLLGQLSSLGAVMRVLAGIDWASQCLGEAGNEKPMWKMRAFDQELSLRMPQAGVLR